MEISNLKSDPEKVRSALAEVRLGNNYSLVAKEEVKVCFPKIWLESDMGNIDSKISVFAMVGLIVDSSFCYIDALAFINLNPLDVSIVKIEDIEYYILTYQKGQTITDSTTLVRDGLNTSKAFNEFLAKAKTPWYIGYVGICNLFRTSQLHAGYNTKTDRSIHSFMTGNRSRDPSNSGKLFRYTLKSQEDVYKQPVMLPLTSVSGATSATSRLAGSNMKEGIVESIVNPTTTLEDTDKVLFL